MERRRRKRDLIPAGSVSPRGLGFSASRARRLALVSAWERVAGPGIARRAAPGALRRGELDVEVRDPGFAAALEELLPRLLGRLAAELPRAGIERGRLVVAGEDAPRESVAAARPPEGGSGRPARAGAARRAAGGRGAPSADATVDEARLRRAMERYLARATQKP